VVGFKRWQFSLGFWVSSGFGLGCSVFGLDFILFPLAASTKAAGKRFAAFPAPCSLPPAPNSLFPQHPVAFVAFCGLCLTCQINKLPVKTHSPKKIATCIP